MMDEMITLDEKIANIEAYHKKHLDGRIAYYNKQLQIYDKYFNENNGKLPITISGASTKDELLVLKAAVEIELNDNPKLHPIGYPYFEDVLYLDEEYIEEFIRISGKSEEDNRVIIMAANYLK